MMVRTGGAVERFSRYPINVATLHDLMKCQNTILNHPRANECLNQLVDLSTVPQTNNCQLKLKSIQ